MPSYSRWPASKSRRSRSPIESCLSSRALLGRQGKAFCLSLTPILLSKMDASYRFMLFLRLTTLILVFLCSFVGLTAAYVPAQATNDSSVISASLSQSSNSKAMINLSWYPNGTSSQVVSFQLVGAYSTNLDQGPIVHFSEDNITNDTTTTPWIAFVSCDKNSTNASMEDDIFTLAQERGAIAALLYSQERQACIINPAYADPASFNQIMDIFSTTSLSVSQLIENSFVAVNQTLYSNFSAQMLNASANIVKETIQDNYVPAPSFLYATLVAGNVTLNNTVNSNANATAPEHAPTSGKNTDLAMIVLYVITGAVSVLFCIVILSGAIRAIRHPERYGPRAGDPSIDGPEGQGQSRARGLTRALVDTFPVIKFSRPADTDTPDDTIRSVRSIDKPLDIESDPGLDDGMRAALEMITINSNARVSPAVSQPEITILGPAEDITQDMHHNAQEQSTRNESPSNQVPSDNGLLTANARHSQQRGSLNLVPDAIGKETCPICIVDFEEGDDLRILPCEGNHVFHQQCVDPWLLELSSSCPICRHDFQTLATMMTGETTDLHSTSEGHERFSGLSSFYGAPRLSRYLRFVQTRRTRNREARNSIAEDSTDSPLPLDPEIRV